MYHAAEAAFGVFMSVVGLTASMPLLMSAAAFGAVIAIAGWHKAAKESAEQAQKDVAQAQKDAVQEEIRAGVQALLPSPSLENFSSMRTADLRARVQAVADRFRALEVRDRVGRPDFAAIGDSAEAGAAYIRASLAHSEAINEEYRREMLSEALSLRDEMQRRLGAPTPTGRNRDVVALDYGMLAGVNPLSTAANYLEGLARQLA